MKPISLVSDLMIFSLFILSFQFSLTTTRAAGGKWQLLQQNVGISAMHMQLLYNDRVIMFDRTDFGKSNLSLPNGTCVRNDCTAHSAEYDVTTNTVRPLTVQSDIWCSSGSVAPNGNLIQTGGYDIGERRVRVFEPCTGCDWKEYENTLGVNRWYATDHSLPDGRQIIIGGRRQFNYEFYPKTESSSHVYSFPFLVQTNDPVEKTKKLSLLQNE